MNLSEQIEKQSWAQLMLKENLYHASHSDYYTENEKRIITRRRKHLRTK